MMKFSLATLVSWGSGGSVKYISTNRVSELNAKQRTPGGDAVRTFVGAGLSSLRSNRERQRMVRKTFILQ